MNEPSFTFAATECDSMTKHGRERPPQRIRHRKETGEKREAIMRAAIKAFARHGYFNSQVADIAQAAGVATGTVYLYFASKDDLLVSIFDRAMGQAIEEGRRALETVTDPIARLDEIARLHLERIGRNRDLAIVFQVELRQSIKFMERFSATLLRDYLGIIRDAIAKGQDAGLLRDGLKPTIAAKLFFGMLDELATNWVLSPRAFPLEAEAPLVVDLFVNGLGLRSTHEAPTLARHAASTPHASRKRPGPASR
jgi:TetR/AcrR family transcriptional regulator, fatty acid metabolism regulator protein